MAAANAQSAAEPEIIQANQILALLHEALPAEWQQRNSGADFDTIQAALDQLERGGGRAIDLAESARLDAYAVLESGSEAKLVVFAPQLKQSIMVGNTAHVLQVVGWLPIHPIVLVGDRTAILGGALVRRLCHLGTHAAPIRGRRAYNRQLFPGQAPAQAPE